MSGTLIKRRILITGAANGIGLASVKRFLVEGATVVALDRDEKALGALRHRHAGAALHVVTTVTGSALLALALAHEVREPHAIWAAAHVDEDWNIEKWGIDEEVAARRAAREVDFRAAARILKALKA